MKMRKVHCSYHRSLYSASSLLTSGSAQYDEAYFQHLGRIAGRMVDNWDNFTLIINTGVVGLIRKADPPTTTLYVFSLLMCVNSHRPR